MAIRGYVLIETEVGSARTVGEDIQRLQRPDAKVVNVDTVTGPFDVIVQLEADDLDKLGNCITDGIQAVRGVSFRVRPASTVALVGESGSGKSVTALSILKLLPGSARHPSGSIRFKGRELLGLPEREIRHVRGNVWRRAEPLDKLSRPGLERIGRHAQAARWILVEGHGCENTGVRVEAA